MQEGVKKLTSVWAPNRETTFAFSNPSETIDRTPADFLLHVAKFKTQFLHSFLSPCFPHVIFLRLTVTKNEPLPFEQEVVQIHRRASSIF